MNAMSFSEGQEIRLVEFYNLQTGSADSLKLFLCKFFFLDKPHDKYKTRVEFVKAIVKTYKGKMQVYYIHMLEMVWGLSWPQPAFHATFKTDLLRDHTSYAIGRSCDEMLFKDFIKSLSSPLNHRILKNYLESSRGRPHELRSQISMISEMEGLLSINSDPQMEKRYEALVDTCCGSGSGFIPKLTDNDSAEAKHQEKKVFFEKIRRIHPYYSSLEDFLEIKVPIIARAKVFEAYYKHVKGKVLPLSKVVEIDAILLIENFSAMAKAIVGFVEKY